MLDQVPKIFAVVIALQHFGFFVLESFFWTKPVGRKIFRQSVEQAEASKVLALNQGFYNAILAAGLVWSLVHPDAYIGNQIRDFFFGAVLVAGLVGGWSVHRKIFYIQGLPALIGLGVSLILGPVS